MTFLVNFLFLIRLMKASKYNASSRVLQKAKQIILIVMRLQMKLVTPKITFTAPKELFLMLRASFQVLPMKMMQTTYHHT